MVLTQPLFIMMEAKGVVSEERARSCLCAFDSVSLLETLLMSATVHTNAFAYLLFKYSVLVHDHIRALVAVTTKS